MKFRRSGLVDTLVAHVNTNGVWPNFLVWSRAVASCLLIWTQTKQKIDWFYFEVQRRETIHEAYLNLGVDALIRFQVSKIKGNPHGVEGERWTCNSKVSSSIPDADNLK